MDREIKHYCPNFYKCIKGAHCLFDGRCVPQRKIKEELKKQRKKV